MQRLLQRASLQRVWPARRLLLGLVVAALGAGCSGSEPEAVRQAKAELEPVVAHPALEGLAERIDGSLENWRLPGPAVAVTVGDDLVFAEGFGVKELSMVDQALAGLDAQRDETAPPSGPLEDFVGRYSSEHAGALEVDVTQDGQLALAFEGHGAFSGTLVPWKGDTFRLYFDGGDGQAYSSALVTFTPDESGLVIDMGRFGQYRRETGG